MLWVLDKRLVDNADELDKRRSYIEDVTHKEVSKWKLVEIRVSGYGFEFYQCESNNEYGVVLICHNCIVLSLLEKYLKKKKKAIVVVIACSTEIEKKAVYNYVKKMNKESKLYYPRQDSVDNIQYTVQDNRGAFGFRTCGSERSLCFYSEDGFIRAIDKSFVLCRGGI